MNSNNCPVCHHELSDCTERRKALDARVEHSVICSNECYHFEKSHRTTATSAQNPEKAFIFDETIRVSGISLHQTWSPDETDEEKALRESLRDFHIDMIKKRLFLLKVSS